jgi:steroid 5-alpha reductase family enzyme
MTKTLLLKSTEVVPEAVMPTLIEPLVANICLMSALWLYCCWRRDVSLVDMVWSLMFVLAAWIWFEPSKAGVAQWGLMLLIMAWGLRLHIYLARRNLGEAEDRRYAELRRKYAPGFWWKSGVLVFLLQALLAWVASLAIFGALQSSATGTLWWLGVGLALFGLGFEVAADSQLARFKAESANNGKVLDTGLWRLTRHPNYFGEACFWWGIGLVALPQFSWGLISPVLMSFLLLRVSGVSLLEYDIADRRPEYRVYVRSTPAFFPDFSKVGRVS